MTKQSCAIFKNFLSLFGITLHAKNQRHVSFITWLSWSIKLILFLRYNWQILDSKWLREFVTGLRRLWCLAVIFVIGACELEFFLKDNVNNNGINGVSVLLTILFGIDDRLVPHLIIGFFKCITDGTCFPTIILYVLCLPISVINFISTLLLNLHLLCGSILHPHLTQIHWNSSRSALANARGNSPTNL